MMSKAMTTIIVKGATMPKLIHWKVSTRRCVSENGDASSATEDDDDDDGKNVYRWT